jgi:hypothetical protein
MSKDLVNDLKSANCVVSSTWRRTLVTFAQPCGMVKRLAPEGKSNWPAGCVQTSVSEFASLEPGCKPSCLSRDAFTGVADFKNNGFRLVPTERSACRVRAQRYTENNPVKAALVAERKAWRWGSARWRDEYERLPWQRDGAAA